LKIEFETQELLDLREAAKQLRITRATLYRWMAVGKVGSVRFGGYRAIPRAEVERILAELKRRRK